MSGTRQTSFKEPSKIARAEALREPDADEHRDVQPALASRRWRLAVAAAVAAAVVVSAGAFGWWWYIVRDYVSTNDAYIAARPVMVSAQVSGRVVDVPVTDNQFVDGGSVLVRIDDRDYKFAVAQAKALADQAEASVANLNAQIEAQQAKIDQARKQVAQAQAALTFSEEENVRYQDLYRKGAGTEQRAQQAASDLKEKQASLAAAEANASAVEKQIEVLKTSRQVAHAQYEQAIAQLDQAKVNLDRTVITAPAAGWATQITAAKGTYAQVGQALMMFVPKEMWVVANFKETELYEIRPGQRVDIAIDAYPGRVFRGHVASIQAGSGVAFSLLPPENATGNFVKVVQRVPVKIVFDELPDVHIGPGMSVVPTVKIR